MSIIKSVIKRATIKKVQIWSKTNVLNKHNIWTLTPSKEFPLASCTSGTSKHSCPQKQSQQPMRTTISFYDAPLARNLNSPGTFLSPLVYYYLALRVHNCVPQGSVLGLLCRDFFSRHLENSLSTQNCILGVRFTSVKIVNCY